MNERVLEWRKSRFSPSANCVEVARPQGSLVVLIRDSKQPNGARLQFPVANFDAFLRTATSPA
jgi:hypothetical protein